MSTVTYIVNLFLIPVFFVAIVIVMASGLLRCIASCLLIIEGL